MKRYKRYNGSIAEKKKATTNQFCRLRALCESSETEDKLVQAMELLDLSCTNSRLVASICNSVPKDMHSARSAIARGKQFFSDCHGFPRRKKVRRAIYNPCESTFHQDTETLRLCQRIWISQKNRKPFFQSRSKVAKFEKDCRELLSSGVGKTTSSRWLSSRYGITCASAKGRCELALRSLYCQSFRKIGKKEGKKRACNSGEYEALKNEFASGIFCRAINAGSKEITPPAIADAIAVAAVVCAQLDIEGGIDKGARFSLWFRILEKTVAGKTPYAVKRLQKRREGYRSPHR